MNWKYIIFVAAVLTSCQKEEPGTGSFVFNEEITLKTGTIYRSPSDFLTVEITKITDSRCPTGVVCFWQGEATVFMEMKEINTFRVILSTFHNPVDTVNNYIFKLIDVLPYPVYQVEIPDSEKTVILQIESL